MLYACSNVGSSAVPWSKNGRLFIIAITLSTFNQFSYFWQMHSAVNLQQENV